MCLSYKKSETKKQTKTNKNPWQQHQQQKKPEYIARDDTFQKVADINIWSN